MSASAFQSPTKTLAQATLRFAKSDLLKAKFNKQQAVKKAKEAVTVTAAQTALKTAQKTAAKTKRVELDAAHELKKTAEKLKAEAEKKVKNTPFTYSELLQALAPYRIMQDDFIDKSQKPLSHVRVYKAKPLGGNLGSFKEVVLSYESTSGMYTDPDDKSKDTIIRLTAPPRLPTYFSWLRAKNAGICSIREDPEDATILHVKDCISKKRGGGSTRKRSSKKRRSSSKKSLRIISGPKKGRCRYGKRKGSGKCRSKATLRFPSGSKKGKCRFGKRKGSKKCRKRSKRKSRK